MEFERIEEKDGMKKGEINVVKGFGEEEGEEI